MKVKVKSISKHFENILNHLSKGIDNEIKEVVKMIKVLDKKVNKLINNIQDLDFCVSTLQKKNDKKNN